MPFGKHKGRRLAEIDSDYLLWLIAEIDLSPGLRLEVTGELRRRGALPDPPAAPASCDSVRVSDWALFSELVERGYRAAARAYHPDLGDGDPEIMTRLNALAADLREQITEARGRRSE
jgi:hypothetical protein